uniref:Uncharacterized protein n=1 Tax=Romanomermis culicivorax TaxID=13658 RepID=A0A915L948_ROMCU
MIRAIAEGLISCHMFNPDIIKVSGKWSVVCKIEAIVDGKFVDCRYGKSEQFDQSMHKPALHGQRDGCSKALGIIV